MKRSSLLHVSVVAMLSSLTACASNANTDPQAFLDSFKSYFSGWPPSLDFSSFGDSKNDGVSTKGGQLSLTDNDQYTLEISYASGRIYTSDSLPTSDEDSSFSNNGPDDRNAYCMFLAPKRTDETQDEFFDMQKNIDLKIGPFVLSAMGRSQGESGNDEELSKFSSLMDAASLHQDGQGSGGVRSGEKYVIFKGYLWSSHVDDMTDKSNATHEFFSSICAIPIHK